MALRAAAAAMCVGRGRNPMFLSSLARCSGTRFPARVTPSLHRASYIHHHSPAVRHQIRAINTETKVEPNTSVEVGDQSVENWKIKMLYDGECPLCMREVNMLQERNKLYGTIKFVDISSDNYSPEENQGLDYETAMGRIHAIESDGTVVTDVEAFRRLYEEVGLGWVYAITKYEPIATIANAVYGVWAKYRMEVTGRPSLKDVFEARRKNRGEVCNDNKSHDV